MLPEILYEDSALLALNKPAGMPVQPDPTGDTSLLDLASRHTGTPMHLVHRLDRPVGGAVLLAKTAEAMTHLTAQFQQHAVDKTYLALVSAAPPATEGTLTHYIRKSGKSNKSILLDEPQPGAVEAALHYRLLHQTDRYWLLEVRPQSGRHHQIRAQLAAVGCPVRGDVKYGARRGNPDRSIQLHAWKLAFEHPKTGEWMEVVAPTPDQAFWKV
ncbi:MAG: RluA family pseudouridine synthase [Saprospiraceae bacterium]|nr:RluA family pseudouridine synthase [Saprospiraceae bacterium]